VQVKAKYALVVKQNKKMSEEIGKFSSLVSRGESELEFAAPNKRLRLHQDKLGWAFLSPFCSNEASERNLSPAQTEPALQSLRLVAGINGTAPAAKIAGLRRTQPEKTHSQSP
jgi:hypothetical protein